jgi:putative hemolysin
LSSALEIIVVLLLILLNGVFALSELAVVSSRKARLRQLANEGQRGAATALKLAEDPHKFLSAVQIGITLVGVLAGAFGGATISDLLAERLATVERLRPYAHALSLALVVGGITYLSLLLGELVPKRLALQNPERVAVMVAPTMQAVSRVTGPLVGLLTFSSNLVLRLIGVRPSNEPPVTEEEIRLMVEEGTRAGIFRRAEQEMISSVFRLDDRLVRDLMTPRHEIQWLDVTDPVEETKRRILQARFSSYPVCREDLDHVLGIALTKNLLRDVLAGQPLSLEKHLQKARFVPENARVSGVLAQLKRLGEHIVLVIDEHGGIQGLVTEHDLFQAIVGDVASDVDLDRPRAVQRRDGSWLIDGLMPFDEVSALIGGPPVTEEMRHVFQTLGGFVMTEVGAVPEAGQAFEWAGYRFEVLDMDGLRVDKVSVGRIPTPDAEAVSEAGAP